MAEVLSKADIMCLKSMVPALAERLIVVDGKPLELERDWQYDLVGSLNEAEIYGKGRQIGYSYATAVRTLTRAQLFPPASYNAVFVSINREEAREKIRYLEFLHESMKEKKKTLAVSKQEVEFVNGNRIQSFPSRAVRGIANVDLYLDEFAHVKDAAEIYSGSTASTVRQSYGVTIGSTPFGRGAFYDIFNGAGQAGEYRRFVAKNIPWWLSRVLCINPMEASVFATGLRTEERVRLFGTENLIREFENQSLEVFQQEFEVFFQDYGNSALTFDLIMSCVDGEMECQPIDIDCSDCNVDVMEILTAALQQQEFVKKFNRCYVGYDVGREINASELILCDWVGGRLETRLYLTLRKCPYSVQKDVLKYVIKNTPMAKTVIDSQGIGNNLAQDLQQIFSTKVIPQIFGETHKAEMVANLTKAFEEKILKVYPTRRITRQLLDVKKIFSATGRILYRSAQTKDDTGGETNYKAHADLFWSLAMAVQGAQEVIMNTRICTTARSPILQGLSNISGWSGKAFRNMVRR